jgi:hypothetical protein
MLIEVKLTLRIAKTASTAKQNKNAAAASRSHRALNSSNETDA